MKLQGRIKVDARTKNLVRFLCPGDIAVIRHDDIDEMAAHDLAKIGAKAIINTGKSMTGRFLASGALILLECKLKLIDVNLPLELFKDNDTITVVDNDIILRNKMYKNVCTHINYDYISKMMNLSEENKNDEVLKFINNTVNHATREMNKLILFTGYPEINTKLKERHVVVVVRNSSSLEEIYALRSYIEKFNPVFIGVDGGADLIINSGYIPDILIGDMDSVSDIGIYKSRELILHAYENGYCPCLERISRMNVPFKIISVRGTSEDAALMLSYQKDAKLIVLVGGHSCMYDFMSKGRAGMASTFITRTLIGSRLVDCKGFNIISASENERKDVKWMKM